MNCAEIKSKYKTFFDFHKEIETMTKSNKLMKKHGFFHATCSGIQGLQGLLQNDRTHSAFCISDDITQGQTKEIKGGWQQQRNFTVFVLMRYLTTKEEDRIEKMQICREIVRQMESRFLKEQQNPREDLVFIDMERIPTSELGRFFATGYTGVYFMISQSEPISLIYNADEWD